MNPDWEAIELVRGILVTFMMMQKWQKPQEPSVILVAPELLCPDRNNNLRCRLARTKNSVYNVRVQDATCDITAASSNRHTVC